MAQRVFENRPPKVRDRPERSRTHGIPSMRCTATAQTTGEQCRNWVTPGTTVCTMHGQTGATLRKAEERVTLAQLLEQDPRHPWQVVLDATHMMDAIVRDFQTQLTAGETITPEQLDRLINVNQIRHHLATTAINTKAHEKISLAFTRHLEMEGELVGTAIGAAIDKLGLTEPWHDYALAVANWTLLNDIGEAQGDEPRPPDEPVVMEYDIGPRAGTAPAIEAGPTAAVQPCDVSVLDDDALRDLGSRVLDELERRDLGT